MFLNSTSEDTYSKTGNPLPILLPILIIFMCTRSSHKIPSEGLPVSAPTCEKHRRHYTYPCKEKLSKLNIGDISWTNHKAWVPRKSIMQKSKKTGEYRDSQMRYVYLCQIWWAIPNNNTSMVIVTNCQRLSVDSQDSGKLSSCCWLKVSPHISGLYLQEPYQPLTVKNRERYS